MATVCPSELPALAGRAHGSTDLHHPAIQIDCLLPDRQLYCGARKSSGKVTDQRIGLYTRCIVLVADGGRADLTQQLLEAGRLPNIKTHITDRGCYRTALSVFPSTTGPAHIPFVSGLHPGTANVPGYRWLCRRTHDARRRDVYRHRSLNSPRGLMLGRDMDPEKSISLFEYFDKPSSILELVDYCPNQHLYKLIARRLYRIVRAHGSDDWDPVDRMVERLVIERIRAGSHCIIASFFGIDEYSHLYSPFHDKTVGAYETIDRAVGNIADVLKQNGSYDETILAVVSDHGLSATTVHIPLVDLVKAHEFNPYYYPKLYRSRHDSAVMESGNAMAQIYFKRGEKWGAHWQYDEMMNDSRIGRLFRTLVNTDGVSFVAARAGENGIIFAGKRGRLRAVRNDGRYEVTVEDDNPLREHPAGTFTADELFRLTYFHTYPDAVNQLFMLLASPRSGDVVLSSEPSYDLRLQHEDPEHHSSHGSLHREHMLVPLALSVPFKDDYVYNYDLVPTILALTGRQPARPLDGRVLQIQDGHMLRPQAADEAAVRKEKDKPGPEEKNGLSSVVITIGIILTGLILVGLFKEPINAFGLDLMTRYGQQWVDVILFLVTAVSSTPLALPIWGYAVLGIALGYNIFRLASVMAVGSALGSFVTFSLGRYFADRPWVQKRFPNIRQHPWTRGKSKKYVTLILFLGTASPIPCDVLYVACGAKRFPALLFLVTMVAARFVRYVYLGYGFAYFSKWI
ncbi:MAG TPA: alkaline phosphatase family protein [Acidobacteriota bacterium]|nr:alkaline phosphatase family protein [Acidobacteriota bacterium]